MKKNQKTFQSKGNPMKESLLKRRSFLKFSGASAAISAVVISGCDNGEEDGIVDLKSGDIGLLNYVYVLEQLEADFYSKVTSDSAFMTTFTEQEQSVLTDVRDHEIAHRDFIKNALGIDAIEPIETSLESLNFSNKSQVLKTAIEIEDLGVAAYNGAGKLFSDANLLLIVSKIASVEARHSAAIRDLLNSRSADFAGDDTVDESGFDKALNPQDVLSAAAAFVKTKLNAINLPTT